MTGSQASPQDAETGPRPDCSLDAEPGGCCAAAEPPYGGHVFALTHPCCSAHLSRAAAALPQVDLF